MNTEKAKKRMAQAERMRKQIICQFSDMIIDMNYLLCVPSVHAIYQGEEIVVTYSGGTMQKTKDFPLDKEDLLIK